MKTKTLIQSIFVLLLAACGKIEPSATVIPKAANPYGTFSSATCFKNKLASMGFGQDIFTIASMEFRNDGTGTSTFELFTDQTCATSALVGSAEISYAVTKNYGNVAVLQIDQLNDPNDPNSNMRYWMLVIVSESGYLIDTNFALGTSGPHVAEPTEAEAQAFTNNLNDRAVFFQRQ